MQVELLAHFFLRILHSEAIRPNLPQNQRTFSYDAVSIQVINITSTNRKLSDPVMAKRAAGFLIFRRLCERIEYLMLQASYGQHHWSPPKGHVDPGEDDFKTALRETCEESGYQERDLRIYKTQTRTLEYKVKGHDKVVVYWLAELIEQTKEVKLSDEHQDLKWLERDDAIQIAGYDDFAAMVRYFDEKIKQSYDQL